LTNLIWFDASLLRNWILLSVDTALDSQVIINLEKRHIGDIVSHFGSIRPIVEMLTHGVISVLLYRPMLDQGIVRDIQEGFAVAAE
jgi:hypothetical protein